MSPSTSTGRLAMFATVGCAGLAALGFGLTSALGSSRAKPQGAPAPAIGSASPQLSTQAMQHFSVFSAPAGSAEDRRVVDEALSTDKDLALDASSVRLAQTADGIQVRVAGDSKSVCVVGRIPGKAIWGGCAPSAAAISPSTPGVGATAYPPGEISHPGGKLAVDALFPDGTSNVMVKESDGATTPMRMVGNTVAFIASQDGTLEWTGPEGLSYSSGLPH
jgi:hypothetical protein